MRVDVLIQNGHVIDPANGKEIVRDVAVCGGKIISAEESMNAAYVVDASNCYVTPGLIDAHGHFFYHGNWLGMPPDRCLPTGVTSVIDGGTAGWINYPSFYRDILTDSLVTCKAYLALTRYGVCNPPELYDLQHMDAEKVVDVFEKYRHSLLGLKIRANAQCVQDIHVLEEAVRLAERLHTGLCVHVAGASIPMADIASILRPGDVFLHMYHGTGQTVLRENGEILPQVYAARKRGVLFDMSCGEANFYFDVAERCMQQGFYPDIISTDITLHKFQQNKKVRSLPHVMSKMLELGMPLTEVVRATTQTPARLMGLEAETGSLAPGTQADIAIFKIKNTFYLQKDSAEKERTITRVIAPQMTICKGEIAWAAEDFNLYGKGAEEK